MHNQAPIQRRKSKRIYVGNVPIGDGAPIAVQSMTNTRTTDVAATVSQIKALERVGADIVRVSVPTMDAAEAFTFNLLSKECPIPIIIKTLKNFSTPERRNSLSISGSVHVSRIVLMKRIAGKKPIENWPMQKFLLFFPIRRP